MKKENNEYCCTTMVQSVDDPEVPISYHSVFREYSLDLNFPASKRIDYCPWCSTKLPSSVRNNFFDILEHEYKIDDGILEIFSNKWLPEEFKSDIWWKKRKL